jgi:hypothetical protein
LSDLRIVKKPTNLLDERNFKSYPELVKLFVANWKTKEGYYFLLIMERSSKLSLYMKDLYCSITCQLISIMLKIEVGQLSKIN